MGCRATLWDRLERRAIRQVNKLTEKRRRSEEVEGAVSRGRRKFLKSIRWR